MINNFLFTNLLKHLEKIHTGALTFHTPDHKKYEFSGSQGGPKADIYIYDWNAIPEWVAKGDIGFAETYREGLWETNDLLAALNIAMLNRDILNPYLKANIFQNFFYQVIYALQKNSIKGSKKNIHAHYDLGNDFYKLWLDPTMTYSSAIYKNDNEDLSQAQNNKYDRIIDSLNGDSGSLLEIGCGWGGFADRALERDKDMQIKGITLSHEQKDFAVDRLQNNAQIVLEDYRHQEGKFDHIVSIEMFEAVGEKYWKTYFEKMKSLLADKGKAVVQTITVANEDFDHYKNETDFLRSYIFPGGLLPSPEKFDSVAQKAGLMTSNIYEFGQDYARTLEEWLKNFDSVVDKVRGLGFDDKFIRLWRFYLAGCAAGFASGYTNVQQVELAHA
ncbi:MAG: cyclopropane-fatty-acyl-phospholipid synthase family protein [Pseudomonadota bacterium]